LLQRLGNQAAIAIENTGLFEQLGREKKERIEAIREIGVEITAGLDLKNVLNNLLQKTLRLMRKASVGEIWLLEDGNKLKVRAAQGDVTASTVDEFSVGEGVVGLVAESKAPYWSGDVGRDPHFKRRLAGTQSELAVPLLKGDQLIGVLNIEHPQIDAFTQEDIPLLEAIASQVVIAFENARLYTELDQRVQQLKVLPGIYEKITAVGIEDVNQILDLLYTEAEKVMNLSNAQVQFAFYDESKDEVSFPLAVERDNGNIIDWVRWSERDSQYRESGEDKIVEQFRPRARREPPGLNEYVIRTKKPLLIVEDFAQTAQALGIRVWPTFGRLDRNTDSWLGVPMMVGGRVIGVISIQSLEVEHAFDQGHLELLSTVANQAAVAIENARLYAQLGEKILELEHAQGEIADRERELVMSGMAMDFIHTVNNLVGPIAPWVTLVKKRLEPEAGSDPKIIEYLDNIARDAAYILREAQQLKEPLTKPEKIDAEELLGSIVAQVEMMVSPELEFEFEAQPALPTIYAVKLQLATALHSVIHNATRATLGQGRVKIRLWQSEKLQQGVYLYIEVSDTGCGIPEDKLDSIFEYGASHWPDRKGNGYGLWRARGIIQSLGGSISARNNSPDNGCTFTILLPVREPGIHSSESSSLEDRRNA
jgi:GAF domain-containing protein